VDPATGHAGRRELVGIQWQIFGTLVTNLAFAWFEHAIYNHHHTPASTNFMAAMTEQYCTACTAPFFQYFPPAIEIKSF
jgi:hypothetical protein